jgi:titin
MLYWPDNAPNETGWEVHQSTTGFSGTFSLLATLAANTSSHAVGGLAARTEYCHKVRSFRKTGGKVTNAAFSNVSCTSTLGPPLAPSGLGAVPGVYIYPFVNLAWTDRADDEQGFRIERAGDPGGPWSLVRALGASWSVGAQSYSDQGVPTDEERCYRVVAFNAYGESLSNVDCTAVPRTPSSISATSSNAQSIDVYWTDAASSEDGYEVQRRVTEGAWQVATNLPANANNFHDGGVTAETAYEYRVRAKRDGGFSDYSASVIVAPVSQAPNAPVLSWASPYGSTSASVGWLTSPFVGEYRLERSTGGAVPWSTVATVPRDSGVVVDPNLTPEQQVCYRVIAHNALGDSPPSNVDCTTPPAAPTLLSAGSGVDGVTWQDNSAVEEGYYVVTLSCNFAWCWEVGYLLPANSTSFTLGFNEWGYEEILYYVAAYSDGGYSGDAGWSCCGGQPAANGGAAAGASRTMISRNGQLLPPHPSRPVAGRLSRTPRRKP